MLAYNFTISCYLSDDKMLNFSMTENGLYSIVSLQWLIIEFWIWEQNIAMGQQIIHKCRTLVKWKYLLTLLNHLTGISLRYHEIKISLWLMTQRHIYQKAHVAIGWKGAIIQTNTKLSSVNIVEWHPFRVISWSKCLNNEETWGVITIMI